MPIARHFTKRLRSDSSGVSVPTRTFSTRNGKQMGVDKISLPITLLSTTNTMSYDAPDVAEAQMTWRFSDDDNVIVPSAANKRYGFQNYAFAESSVPALSSDGSTRTSSEQEHTGTASDSSAPSSPTNAPALTDASSVGSSPECELNHLSCYFPGPGPAALKRTASQRFSNKSSSSRNDEKDPAPALPKRAPSHSKKEHVKLARQRSLRSAAQSRASSPTRGLDTTIPSPPSPTFEPGFSTIACANAPIQRPSFEMFGLKEDRSFSINGPTQATPDDSASLMQTEPSSHHPFGQELEKLDEVAEGFYGVAQSTPGPEDDYLARHGLGRFDAQDYTDMIGSGPRFSVVLDSGGVQRGSWVGWI